MKENLLKEYVAKIDQSTLQRGKLPVKPSLNFTPLQPVEKWNHTADVLTKKFMFRNKEQRNLFIQEVLNLEEDSNAEPVMVMRTDSVVVSLLTKNINVATEIDKEFARACDLLYKSVIL